MAMRIGRELQRGLLAAAALACAVSILWAAARVLEERIGRPVAYIDIAGSLAAREQAIIEERLSKVNRGDPDINRIKHDLEQLSWVDRVSVRRVWPDGLLVTLRKHRAIARWGEDEYLSEEGRSFSLPVPVPERLPELRGPEGSEREVMVQYQQLTKAFQQIGQVIAGVSLGERGEWLVRLRSGVAVRLGKEDISDRLMRLVKVLDEAKLKDRIESIAEIDARYTNGVAVRWRDAQCGDDCYELANNDNRKRVQAYERHGG